MVRIVDKDDPTNGDNESNQFYIGKYNSTSLIELAFSSPELSDETKIDQAKKNRNEFLDGITIKP